jgi:hypothetical protein
MRRELGTECGNRRLGKRGVGRGVEEGERGSGGVRASDGVAQWWSACPTTSMPALHSALGSGLWLCQN